MSGVRVVVVGASGRMGRMLVRAVAESSRCDLVGATERSGSEFLGRDAGEMAGVETLAVRIIDDIQQCPAADVLIDFTAPAATLKHAAFVAERGMGMVIGTTGFDAGQMQQLRDILADSPVVMAANYSVGVNLALSLIERAAQVLGDDYDAEIFEAHHKHKVDAPSGTALAMGKALASGRGVELDDVAVLSREGITGVRKPGSIGFSVVRGGNIVGEHQAMFIADEERIEINHMASDRMVFARGAVRAAGWLSAQSVGWYDMQDMLGLKN
ncbi:4-hydroxy-tetrahydrodipicolinate reductase [Mariprofundus ferrooxydans]|uniref:4-hydroxy-tetrahydrodipicolinate reductase n=1 Tax=Mariprofundus ferrooxydans PV-1 TaxID=314345 RepID=Q0EZ45_9PROT|nr:4-hydroxy-tetrahydrodipicolinate reductase [Mariprofundus ferrooxydans]EAU54579.1 dihydrodipicolinate reductase [Mariprofundus ferrooxydans PV-1]KON48812.1 dihydrodipicolinate reductase [Mariprofundus ferrooxydans]